MENWSGTYYFSVRVKQVASVNRVGITFFKTLPLTLFIAELWRAKRACGAPWVSKSTHPRKFGNHVTVHRPQPARPSAPQENQYSISHFLAILVAQED